MKTSNELLQVAIKQLGNGGSVYRKYTGLGSNQPYCDAFVYWLFNANGCSSLLPWTGTQKTYAPSSMKWCQANLAQIPPYLVMPCDIVYYDWQPNKTPDHVGIVEKRLGVASIHAIEGNTTTKKNGKTVKGVVARKERRGGIQAIFRPHFKPATMPKKEKLDVDGDFGYKSIYMLQVALGITPDAILGKGTVKALQKKAGASQDGAWGKGTTKAVQKLVGVKQDGQWGKDSTIALQKWINKVCFPNQSSGGQSTETKPTTPTVSEPKAYTGAFPNLVTHSGQKIAYTARDLAYAKGTSKSKYTWNSDPKKSGKAKAAFTTAINKVYPKRSSWSKQCQAGASCDVGAGTIIRYSGVDTKVPRGLQEQLDHFKKSSLWKNTGLKKCSLAGDVAMHPSPSAHIWIGLGDGNLAEANHSWKYFEHITKDKRTINSKAKAGVYRCTKASPISKGDRGTEVIKMQNFLNWAGFNCGKADGAVGPNTLAAIKSFQSNVGLTPDGEFGSQSLTKAKAFKK